MFSKFIRKFKEVDSKIMAEINKEPKPGQETQHSTLGSLFSPVFTGIVESEDGKRSYWINGVECTEGEYNG